MATVEEVEPITGELIEAPKEIPILFNVSDERIATLRSELTGLTIGSTEDYQRVTKGIAICRTLRTAIEKCRKGLKEHALEYGRKVDREAKRLTEQLEAIDEPLKLEKAKVDEEKERKKREAEEAKRKLIDSRIKSLLDVGYSANPMDVANWSQEEFEKTLAECVERDKELKRMQAEAAAAAAKAEAERQEQLRIERERLEAERAELARLRAEEEARQREAAAKRRAEHNRIEAEQAAERKKLEAERAAIQAEKDRIAREEWQRQETIRIEKEAAEQAERERLEAIERAERQRIQEEKAEEDRKKAEAAEAERLEALKPDREKIAAFGDVLRLIEVPEASSHEGILFVRRMRDELEILASRCEGFGQ